MKLPAASTEYIYATVTGDHDLTSATAEVALPSRGNPPQTWRPATVVDVTGNDSTWTATIRILLGPQGDVTLDVGNYDFWVRLLDSPEQPTRLAGQVQAS